MKRQWRVKRTTVARLNGQHRWDRVYQLLLQWEKEREQTDKIGRMANELQQEQANDK